MTSEATPGREELLAANMQASIQVGPLQCSQGGHPYNGDHIEYWKSRAIKAELRLAAKPTEWVDVLKESRSEIAEIRKNVCEVHDAGGFGTSHPKFEEHAKREIARLDGLLDRIDRALSTTEAPNP